MTLIFGKKSSNQSTQHKLVTKTPDLPEKPCNHPKSATTPRILTLIFFKNTGDINAPPGSKDKKNSSNSKAEKTEKDQTAAQKPSFERRESIDMPSIGGNGDTTKKPTERNVERRDSIDMPSIGEDLDEDKQSSVSADQVFFFIFMKNKKSIF